MAINKFVLKNGLRVVHQEESASPMVVINTLYDVGAKDEDPDHTGFAHLFEHLMFGGSINIPSYDEPIQNAGGEDNAWTCEDFTNYYVMIPASNVEVALWLESDRMLSLNFSQKSLDVQRNVVCEEFKQRNLNQPYGDVSHLVRSMVFKRHPYAWPTIGKELSHIENATLDEVKQFFFSHYAPTMRSYPWWAISPSRRPNGWWRSGMGIFLAGMSVSVSCRRNRNRPNRDGWRWSATCRPV